MPNYDDDIISIDCEIKDSTDKAWLVVIDDEEYWVPKSIGDFENNARDVDDVLLVPTWWAKKEGLA